MFSIQLDITIEQGSDKTNAYRPKSHLFSFRNNLMFIEQKKSINRALSTKVLSHKYRS